MPKNEVSAEFDFDTFLAGKGVEVKDKLTKEDKDKIALDVFNAMYADKTVITAAEKESLKRAIDTAVQMAENELLGIKPETIVTRRRAPAQLTDEELKQIDELAERGKGLKGVALRDYIKNVPRKLKRTVLAKIKS